MYSISEEDDDEIAEVSAPGLEEGGEQVFAVTPEQSGVRLDVFLAERIPSLSRAQIQRIVGAGGGQVNGVTAKPSVKLVTGDLVLLNVPPIRPVETVAENIPLDIVYEDSDLLVVNKAKGMVVHPAPGAPNGTLVNALLYHCKDLSGIGGEERPGIVHRLDKDTTGLLMVAKNDFAHNHLQAQIQKRTAERKYLAFVWGRPAFREAVIDAPIGRHSTDRKRMTVVDNSSLAAGRAAQTHVMVKEPGLPISLIECSLKTGRTHQIRVHCQYAGYPVVADPVYNGERKVGSDTVDDFRLRNALNDYISAMHGQALHAYSLSFNHPRTGERLNFTAPLPPELEKLHELLRRVA